MSETEWRARVDAALFGHGEDKGLVRNFDIFQTQIVTGFAVLKGMLVFTIGLLTLIVGYLTYLANARPVHSMLNANTPTQNASNIESRLQ